MGVNDVKVTINLVRPTGKKSFGIPLIFAGKEIENVPFTYCADLEQVVKAGFEAESEVYKTAQLMFGQDNAPAKIAVFGSTDKAVTALEAVEFEDWRQLVVTSVGTEEESTLPEIAEYMEKKEKGIFFCSVKSASEASGLKSKERTMCMVYTFSDYKCPEAALVGATAGFNPGAFTYKNMILKGITPAVLKESGINEIHDAGCYTFVTKAGDNVTTEGKTCSGEYADIVDTKDFIVQSIEYRCQKILNRLPKVPYTDNGIASLEGETLSVLLEAYNNGVISENDEGEPDYSVSFKKRSECDPVDRAERIYKGGSFSFGLAGAIHNAHITGEILI